MAKKILYFEDLYDFFVNQNKSLNYSAKDTGVPLVVQSHGNLKYDEDNSHEGLTSVHLQACHTYNNINGSNIDPTVMEAALPSFSNRPILGYIHIVNDEPCFYGHNMHEENGELVYDETPIGIIPESCNAQIVYDKDKDKSYVEVDGYIFDEYSKAKEIIEREKESPVSVELSIRSLSYDAEKKLLNIEDFFFSGVTILGKNDDGETVKPGMVGSNITLADFEQEQPDYANQIIEMQKKIDILFSHFNIEQNDAQSLEKGGTEMKLEKTTVINEGNPVVEPTQEEPADTKTFEGEVTETNDNPENKESFEETDPIQENDLANSDHYELTKNGKVVSTYDLSEDDIHYALSNLVNATYGEPEETYYYVTVYPNEQYIIMEDCTWRSNNNYKQSYKESDGTYSLIGDRIAVQPYWITEEELNSLKEMKKEYSSLVDFKATTEANELHAKRMEVMSSDKYAVISNKNADGNYANKSYADLYENMDQYTCDELDEKLKAIVGEYAINGGKFEKVEEHKTTHSAFKFTDVTKKGKRSKYGMLQF